MGSRGTLWVVATPIGNLGDISARAVATLRTVDLIACEDTRHSGLLLVHLGIERPLISLNDHNEAARCETLLARLAQGESVALISDAGTPLISDPGYKLVAAAREAGIEVRPIPGACALIAGLSVAGIASNRFLFEGFLPAQARTRRARIQALSVFEPTLIFYESPHRIVESLNDICELLGPARRACVGREMTKQFEQYLSGTLAEISAHFSAENAETRGEFVVIVEGNREEQANAQTLDARALFRALSEEMSASQAARITAKLSGLKRQEIYAWRSPAADEDASD